MAKLTILIALVVALVLVVHTSAFRSSEQSCKRQLQQVNLRHCENHIAQKIQQQQDEEEGRARTLRGIKHFILRDQSSQESEELDQCCEQLYELNSQRCQCCALKQIYESQSEQCEGRQQEQQLEEELEKLPRTCGFRPLRKCNVNPNEN
ncbi:unnamed protein product [Lupinus luteus]|uniref:Bifunctional inhibitor/plant lipid transfer protein/seed storage helical domain-containing protein n=1 Tax=Lupinus luteus TaxID=3873 RepID=A0AAV1YH60_LUPLU